MKARWQLVRRSIDEDYKIYIPDKNVFEKKIIYLYGLKTQTFVDLEITVTRFREKTKNQLGYFHAEVLPKTLIAFWELGWNFQNENQVKVELKKLTGFYDEFINENTGEITIHLKSITNAKIDELSYIINYAIVEICGTAGVKVKLAEEFKKNIIKTKKNG